MVSGCARNTTAGTGDVDVEPAIAIEITDCSTLAHVNLGQSPFAGAIGEGAVAVIDEEVIRKSVSSTTGNVEILPTIPVKISTHDRSGIGGMVIHARYEGDPAKTSANGLVTELWTLSRDGHTGEDEQADDDGPQLHGDSSAMT